MKSKGEVKILTVVTSSIVAHEQEVTVSPLQLLGRNICLLDGSLDLPASSSVMFVLAPRHSQLFGQVYLLCTAKAALWSLLASLVYTPSKLPDDPQYIGDGGHLLWMVTELEANNGICQSYVRTWFATTNKMLKLYSGHDLRLSTKSVTISQESMKKILMAGCMPTTTTSLADSLSNVTNKGLVTKLLTIAGVDVQQATSDAGLHLWH